MTKIYRLNLCYNFLKLNVFKNLARCFMAVKTKDYVVNVVDTQDNYIFSAKKKIAFSSLIYLKA